LREHYGKGKKNIRDQASSVLVRRWEKITKAKSLGESSQFKNAITPRQAYLDDYRTDWCWKKSR